MRIRYAIVLGLGLLVAAQANAAGFFENMAIRGGVGAGKLSFSSNTFKAHSAGWNIFAGFEFNPYFAVEGGRLEGGSPNQTAAAVNDELKNFSWHASAIGSWPLTDEVSIFARGGMLSWHATERLKSGSTVTAIGSDKGNDPIYGGGFAINVDSGLLRLEYDRSKIAGADVSFISASVVWRFRL